jgi:hypothetical protein
MPTRINFGGQSVRIPGAYSKTDASAMTPAVLGAFNRVGIIGTATGGAPKTVKLYTSQIAAENDFISGEILEGMKLMWGPSPNTAGASEILACRVQAATPSFATLLDTVGNSAVKLTARNYGKHTDNITRTIDPASDGYGKKIAIEDSTMVSDVPEQNYQGLGTAFQLTRVVDPDDGLKLRVQIINTIDADYKGAEFEDESGVGTGPYVIYLDTTVGNIPDHFIEGMNVIVSGSTSNNRPGGFTVVTSTYSGTRVKLTVTEAVVTEAALPATLVSTTETNTLKTFVSGTLDLSLDLTVPAFSTVIKVVEYINNNYPGIYAARIVGDSTTSRYLDSTKLDTVYTVEVGSNITVSLTAHIQLLVDWINRNSTLVSAERLAGAWIYPVVDTEDVFGNIVALPLSGGTTSTDTQSDWEAAIDKFEAEEVQLMVVMTDVLGVQLYLKNHIAYMSSQGRSERRGYYGHPLDLTVPQIKDRALALFKQGNAVVSGCGIRCG